MIERALAAADAAEVEPQYREAACNERVIDLIDDLVVHRAVKLRMRVQHHRDRRILLLCRMVAALETACRAGENNFGHQASLNEIVNRHCARTSACANGSVDEVCSALGGEGEFEAAFYHGA